MNANTTPVAAEPKAAVTSASRKARPRASRSAAKAEKKLVCYQRQTVCKDKVGSSKS